MAGNRTVAARLLDRAASIVDGDRRQQHGAPERSFTAIAELWNAYLRARAGRFVNGTRNGLDGVDVAHMLGLMKLGRSLCGEPHPDHYCDHAGYAALAGELELLGTATALGNEAAAEAPAQPGQPEPDDQVERVLQEVAAELKRATGKHPRMASLFEAAAIIREEHDELWAEIKRQKPDLVAVRREALQLGAMCARLVADVLGEIRE